MADTQIEERESFGPEEWKKGAEAINDDLVRRKKLREDREKDWAEIDRQVKMEAVPWNIPKNRKRPLKGTEWMSFVEPPYQAETLEILTADFRRLLFPIDQNYFSAHSLTDDDLLDALSELADEITMGAASPGDRINQDMVDKMVEGMHLHYQRLYDFRGVWDNLAADAFKYGEFVGRVKIHDPKLMGNTFRGQKGKSPMLIPRSIKDTYLDDLPMGAEIDPSTIWTFDQRLADLQVAAMKGSRDPESPSGGWIPDNLAGVEPRKDGTVAIAEFEGDLLISQSQAKDFLLRNVIVTTVTGLDGKGSAVTEVIRFRVNSVPFHSYLSGAYHFEDLDAATSPLMMGRPLQKSIFLAQNTLDHLALLNAEPPISYDPQDPYFAGKGGPEVMPRAKWKTVSGIEVHEIGNPTAMAATLGGYIEQFRDVTGTQGPRLGQQTKSHQTLGAVDSEIERGTVRTVDFVRSVMAGAMTTYLAMEYHLMREVIDTQEVYIPDFQGFVKLDKGLMPETVIHEVHGLGGPAEERQKQQAREKAVANAVGIVQAAGQAGVQVDINYPDLVRLALKEGFDERDVAAISVSSQPANAAGAAEQPAIPGANNGAGVPGPGLAGVA